MLNNEQVHELINIFGLSIQQIIKIKTNNFSSKLDSSLLAKQTYDPKEDIFQENFDWVYQGEDTLWNFNVNKYQNICGIPEKYFPYFHSENEFLRSIPHDDLDPNLRVLKLGWYTKGILIIPLRFIQENEKLTRDWVYSCPIGSKRRSSLLISLNVQFLRMEQEVYHKAFVKSLQENEVLQGSNVVLQLPSNLEAAGERFIASSEITIQKGACKVFTDDPVLLAYLSTQYKEEEEEEEFELCSTKEQAEYCYLLNPLKFGDSRQEVIPKTLKGLNQFPYEAALVRKDICLVQVCRACSLIKGINWVLPAYDLSTELAHFIIKTTREERIWVIKPAQQARSFGIVVTKSLPVILASMSGPGGDKVAQEYVGNPLLIMKNRKFDLRTIVMVRQFRPELIACINVSGTYARVARDEFSIDCLSNKRSHLTVSKYETKQTTDEKDEMIPLIVSRNELISSFPSNIWLDIIEPRAWLMIKQLLSAAGHWIGPNRYPPCNAACYGVDWIIDSEYQPKLIEVNYCPDLSTPTSICPSLPLEIMTILTSHPQTYLPQLSKDWRQL